MIQTRNRKTLTLARAKCGERLRVSHICPDCKECLRLRELGFYDHAEVQKISDGAAIICLLLGMRVAIGRDLGEHVHVERVAA
jgi:Fe2+ transport system protein FeoA